MPFKSIVFLICLNFYCSNIESQTRVWIDEIGETVEQYEFLNRWRNKYYSLSRWDSIGKDNIRYCTLQSKLYLKGYFDYNLIKSELEKIISSPIDSNSVIIIDYYFKDDLCSPKFDNHWSSAEINRRKSFNKPYKKQISTKGITLITLFELGMTLKNRPKSKREYYFLDKNNFFRNNIFKHPTLCGSFAAIKPNGQTLVRNGESRVDYFAEYLNDEKWSVFFPSSQQGENSNSEN